MYDSCVRIMGVSNVRRAGLPAVPTKICGVASETFAFAANVQRLSWQYAKIVSRNITVTYLCSMYINAINGYTQFSSHQNIPIFCTFAINAALLPLSPHFCRQNRNFTATAVHSLQFLTFTANAVKFFF